MGQKVRSPFTSTTGKPAVRSTTLGSYSDGLCVGLPEIQTGEVGILAAVDCFTGFVFAEPVKAMTVDVSVNFLVDYLIL